MAKNKKITVTKNVPVLLSISELLEISKELARANQELARVSNQKKETMASFAASQKIAEAIIENLSLKISTGKEYRDVDCSVTFDQKLMKKFITRMDTGEVVETTKLTTADLQEELEFYEGV